MTTRHFDAVVVGGRLSAAIAASLLAKRGLRGLLVDQGELAGIEASLPANLVMSDDASLAMRLVHTELGVREDLKVRSRALTPGVQAIFPDERVDLSVSRPALLAEVGRAFGPAASGLKGLLERLDAADRESGEYLANIGELPASGFFAKRHAASIARRHPSVMATLKDTRWLDGLPDPIVRLITAPLPFLTHLDGRSIDGISVLRFARPFARFLRGLSHLEGNVSVRELLLDLAKRKGFEIRRSAMELIDPQGRSIHFGISGSRDVLTTDVLIEASSDLSGLDTVPGAQRGKDLPLMLQAAKPRGFVHSFSIEIDRAVIPPGMAQVLILLNGRNGPSRKDESDPDAEDRPILLVSRAARHPHRITLVASHPVSSVRVHAQSLDKLEEVIQARIQRLIPFFSDGRPEVEHANARRSVSSERASGHPLFELGLDPLTGITGISMRTPFKNVFVAGPAVVPGLGVEGEYLSALQAVDACEAVFRGVKRPKTLAARAP